MRSLRWDAVRRQWHGGYQGYPESRHIFICVGEGADPAIKADVFFSVSHVGQYKPFV